MQHKKILSISILVLSVMLLQQCSKKDNGTTTPIDTTPQPNLPATTFNYITTYPAHIQSALTANDNTPADNPITNDGATLGRVLFYDKHLSKNNTVSCGSCHKPESSFSDNAQFSKGFDNGLTTKNSMPVLNLRFYKSGKMFWDERAPTLEKQVLQPIQNTVEMGLTLAELEAKVKALNYYPALFQKAFGSTAIDSVKIAKAVSQFMRSIVTYQSRYDLVKQGLATFTPAEAAGEQVFLNAPPGGNSCASCHTPPMFLTSTPVAGFAFPLEAGINGQNRFKSPSLRNIAATAPYFHSGAIASLTAMLNGGPAGAPTHVPAHSIAPADAGNVLAFLQTLTDNAVTTDVKFSDPFK
jgi:cytochrome c peroxidase